MAKTLYTSKIKSLEKETSKKTNDHHIVAQTAKSAQPAREVLKENNISVQDHDNRVDISREWHWFVHPELYYTSINTIMVTANESTEDMKKQQNRVRGTLKTIKTIFKFIDLIFPE